MKTYIAILALLIVAAVNAQSGTTTDTKPAEDDDDDCPTCCHHRHRHRLEPITIDSTRYFSVLPGVGYEPLLDDITTNLFDFSYSQKRRTPDKFSYLVPDQVEVRKVDHQDVDYTSTFVSNVHQYTEKWGSKVNIGGTYDSVKGSFGTSHQNAKTYLTKGSTSLASTKANVELYDLTVYTSTPLAQEPRFIIESALCALEYGLDFDAANLLSKFLGDYGSTFLYRVHLGFRISSQDFVSNEYVKQTGEQQVSHSASLGFLDLFNIGGSTSSSTSNLDEYTNNVNHRTAIADGCGPWVPGMLYKDWVAQCVGGEALLGGEALPTYELITPMHFPTANATTVRRAYNMVRDLTHKLVELNSYKGCMDPDSPNFHLRNNIDNPAACDSKVNGTMLGGFFVSCSGDHDKTVYDDDFWGPSAREESLNCDGINPITSGQSCPIGFKQTVVYRDPIRTINMCYAESEPKEGSAYLFGGIYSNNQGNAIAGGTKGCPAGFNPYPIENGNVNGMNGITFCLAEPAQQSLTSAVEYGGMFSCMATNDLAELGAEHPMSAAKCPQGYDAVLVDQSPDGSPCPLWYCTKLPNRDTFPDYVRYPVKTSEMPKYGICTKPKPQPSPSPSPKPHSQIIGLAQGDTTTAEQASTGQVEEEHTRYNYAFVRNLGQTPSVSTPQPGVEVGDDPEVTDRTTNSWDSGASPSGGSSDRPATVSVGALVGSIMATVVLTSGIALIIVYAVHRRRRNLSRVGKHAYNEGETSPSSPAPDGYENL